MPKKDLYADVRGKEILCNFSMNDGTKEVIPVFVSGISDTAISLHPIDKEAYVKLWMKHCPEYSEEEVRNKLKPPQDFVMCVNLDRMLQYGKRRHKVLLAILRSGRTIFDNEEITADEKHHFFTYNTVCPF